MISYLKQIGVLAAGVVAVFASSPPVHAQLIRPGFRVQGPINLNQAAFNQAMTGQVHPGVSPYSSYTYGNPLYNPFVNPIANPYANPVLNPALNPAALLNYTDPRFAFRANPINNPYTNPYTNPYMAATGSFLASSYAGYNNPYLTSSGYSPYGGTAAMTLAAMEVMATARVPLAATCAALQTLLPRKEDG